MNAKEKIARRVAREFKDGDYANLGIGVPTQVSNYLPAGVNVTLQAENGFLGLGPAPEAGKEDKDIVDAGGAPVTMIKGAACFDSATSFGIIRGGHLKATVLGALEVDREGNIASWIVPGKKVPGMGGAMDLVVGAEKVIVAMEHTTRGAPKILEKCTLPLTAEKEVDLIVTELAVIKVTPAGLVLKEIAQGATVEDVQAATAAKLIVEGNIGTIEI